MPRSCCCNNPPVYPPVECGLCTVAPGAFQVTLPTLNLWETDITGVPELGVLASAPGGTHLCDNFRTMLSSHAGGTLCFWLGPSYPFCMLAYTRARPVVAIDGTYIFAGWQTQINDEQDAIIETHPTIDLPDNTFGFLNFTGLTFPLTDWTDCDEIDGTDPAVSWIDGVGFDPLDPCGYGADVYQVIKSIGSHSVSAL